MLQIGGMTKLRRMPLVQEPDQGPSHAQRQDKLRETVREWLLSIMDKHNVSQRQLGLRSGVSPATINRALDTDGSFVMSTSIMSKISDAFGEPMPTALTRSGALARPAGFSESDLVAYAGPDKTASGKPEINHGRWKIANEVLDIEGFRPGDVLDFDLSMKPEPGDFVVAQVYNLQRGTADTILRQYQPPYLLTRSTDRSIDARPLYVDGERVVIMGTFTRMTRDRNAG